MASPSETAMRARVLAHMNNDHQADLSLYLRHVVGLSPAAAARAQMTDADLSSMTIRSVAGTHRVPINPPIARWSEARSRLVRMSAEAHAALDPVAYEVPRGTEAAVLASVVFYIVCLGLVKGGFGRLISVLIFTPLPPSPYYSMEASVEKGGGVWVCGWLTRST